MTEMDNQIKKGWALMFIETGIELPVSIFDVDTSLIIVNDPVLKVKMFLAAYINMGGNVK